MYVLRTCNYQEPNRKTLPVTTQLEMIFSVERGSRARDNRARNPRFVTEFTKSFMHITQFSYGFAGVKICMESS